MSETVVAPLRLVLLNHRYKTRATHRLNDHDGTLAGVDQTTLPDPADSERGPPHEAGHHPDPATPCHPSWQASHKAVRSRPRTPP